MKGKMMKIYAIKDYTVESPSQWWTNREGWTHKRADADWFTDTERKVLNLPIGGKWVCIGTICQRCFEIVRVKLLNCRRRLG